MEIVRAKAEAYIDSVLDLVVYLQMNDRFEVNEAKKLSLVAQKNGFKLMIHVGPELAHKSIDLSLKLQACIDPSDERPLAEKMNEFTTSSADWYKSYFLEISKYNYQSMPNKMEADAIAVLVGHLMKS